MKFNFKQIFIMLVMSFAFCVINVIAFLEAPILVLFTVVGLTAGIYFAWNKDQFLGKK